MTTPSKAEVLALIKELERLYQQYDEDDEADPEGSVEAAAYIAEKVPVIIEHLDDYLQRCF